MWQFSSDLTRIYPIATPKYDIKESPIILDFKRDFLIMPEHLTL